MSKDKSIDPAHLPESEVYKEKDINQHKHLADTGKPINEKEKLSDQLKGKPSDRTSKEEGLNQQRSSENKGAHESDV
jgi:hypothetical protein